MSRYIDTVGLSLSRRFGTHQTARLFCLVALLLLAACEQKMANQPRFEAYEAAPGWEDDQSARQPVPGTVAREEDLAALAPSLPMPLTRELLERGRQRFEIYCMPCHGKSGYGDGMVVQRGFPAPPSFHTPRLRQLSLRHYVDVITEGYGVMYPYAARVPRADRWAIAAYIRALQLSQHASSAALTDAERIALDGAAKNELPAPEPQDAPVEAQHE